MWASNLADWLRSDSLTAILAVILGVGLLITLVSKAPAALVLLGALGLSRVDDLPLRSVS